MTILYTNPGLRGVGDALFLTPVAHEIKRRSKFSVVVVRNKNFELFFNNPDVDLIVKGYDEANRGIEILPRESSRLPQIAGSRWSYNRLLLDSRFAGRKYNAHHGWPPKKNLLEEVAEYCGLRLTLDQKKTLRPFYWPYRRELEAQKQHKEVICIHSTAATYWTPNKQWPVDRIQKVVDVLAKTHKIVQLGVKDDLPLQGVVDLRGKTKLRETAAILANAKLLIGLEGGLMHMARAVDTRSVIIYTGFITPEYSGYDVNYNLFGAADRKDLPCWNRTKCECDCAERVTVNQVLQGIEWALTREKLPKHFL